MKQAVVTIKYEEEKLNAIKQYMGKKDADFESELNEVLGKMYEKYVPQAVREYIESRGDVPPVVKKTSRQQIKNRETSDGVEETEEVGARKKRYGKNKEMGGGVCDWKRTPLFLPEILSDMQGIYPCTDHYYGSCGGG